MSPGEKVRKSYSSGLCSETEVTSLALVIVFPNQLGFRHNSSLARGESINSRNWLGANPFQHRNQSLFIAGVGGEGNWWPVSSPCTLGSRWEKVRFYFWNSSRPTLRYIVFVDCSWNKLAVICLSARRRKRWLWGRWRKACGGNRTRFWSTYF